MRLLLLDNYLFLSRLMIEKARDIFVFKFEVQKDVEKLSNFRLHLICLFSWGNFWKNYSKNSKAILGDICFDFLTFQNKEA